MLPRSSSFIAFSSATSVDSSRDVVTLKRSVSLPNDLNEKDLRNCPICHEVLLDNTNITPCGHEFHSRCLERWLPIGRNCPSCRKALAVAEPVDLQPESRLIAGVITVEDLWRQQLIRDILLVFRNANQIVSSLERLLEQWALLLSPDAAPRGDEVRPEIARGVRSVINSLVSVHNLLESRILGHLEVEPTLLPIISLHQMNALKAAFAHMTVAMEEACSVISQRPSEGGDHAQHLGEMVRNFSNIVSTFETEFNTI